MQKGFSTLEIMIAMAIMVITLSAVIIVSFGNQGMLIGGQTNAEAMNRAQELLEQQQQFARKDFRLIQATSSTDDIYTKTVTVEPWEGDPYSSKKVTATISWKDQHFIARNVVLTTVLSNFMNAVGGDTCGAPTGNWSAPLHDDYALDNTSLISAAGTYSIGALDAYRGKLYVAASNTSAPTLSTFFVFDISNPPQKPVIQGSLDNNTNSITGINAIQAGNTALISGVPHSYVYAANGYGANFNTCSQGTNCSQLQVFDVSNPANPTLAANFKFATSSFSSPNWLPYVNGSGGQAVGKSIFYKDGYVYLGLTKTGSGPEFTIIDVHNPLNPTPISGYSVGYGVESIYVRGKYAYLATDDTSNKELVVLDISNPLNPTLATNVFNPPGLGYGNAIFAIGDTLYLGKTFAAGSPELYALNITNPGTSVASIGSKTIGSSIAGIEVRGSLGFVLTSTAQQLNVLDVSNSTNMTQYAAPLAMPGTGIALDCEKNFLYAATNAGLVGNISVIKPGL